MHSQDDFKVGDAVYDDRNPKKYGKVIALREPVREQKEYFTMVTWRRQMARGTKDETVPFTHLSKFDELIEMQQGLLDNWTALREKARGL